MFKIAIVGPESTAKSETTKELAAFYNCYFVEEIARRYLAHTKGQYADVDIEKIALEQQLEDDKIFQASQKEGKSIYVADTNSLVTKIWYENHTGTHSVLIDNLWQNHKRWYHIHLLMDIDIPWQPDPLREHPNERAHFFKLYHQILKESNASFAIINGIGKQRLNNALEILKRNLNI